MQISHGMLVQPLPDQVEAAYVHAIVAGTEDLLTAMAFASTRGNHR